MDRITFRVVGTDRWGDLEQLFESPGGPKNCWCMVWRGDPDERRDKKSKKAALEPRVMENVPVGLLGYLEGEPVAWVSIAPRARRVSQPGDPEDVWIGRLLSSPVSMGRAACPD
ncbi:MAG: hypothetical protein GEU90_21770 [Gemmatimonas sp.]|nr:hypothetical protein [Gemmatimonas sp.]